MTNAVVEKHLRLLPGVPLIDSPFFEEICATDYFDDFEKPLARQMNTQGYALLDFPDPDFNAKADRIIQQLDPIFMAAENGGDRFGGKLMPPRFQGTEKISAEVRENVGNAFLLNLLGKLYGRRAFPFSTLIFRKGSQQHLHSDAVHFNSYPKGFMCGVWVALEDVSETNGPVVYYPGSHKWAVYDNEQTVSASRDLGRPPSQAVFHSLWEELIAIHGANPVPFYPGKGQALIWAANLIHAGSEIRNPSATRWSQVTHYFFENCAFYRPMASHLLPGSIQFLDTENIATDSLVKHQYCQTEIPGEYQLECRDRKLAGQTQDPLPQDFDPQTYLKLNPDVEVAGADPVGHYLTHGRVEGRPYK